MSRKYYDGFFSLCATIINAHETISVRGLAPFLEIPRSTLQDGLKRVNHVTGDINDPAIAPLAVTIIKGYFSGKIPSISTMMSDKDITNLYHFGEEIIKEDTPQSTVHSVIDTGTFPDEEQLELLDDVPIVDMSLDDDFEMSEQHKEFMEQMSGEGFTDINDYVVRLARQKQRTQDITREERKVFRNVTRDINMLDEVSTEMHKLLKDNGSKFPARKPLKTGDSEKVGVIQISDLHLGELVTETLSNRFDMDIASKRLHKLIDRSKKLFNADGITKVAVFMTGDLINSTRRISEITSYAAPRVKVVFCAYLILGQMLESLYEDFDVTIANVVGNESRLSEFFDSTNYLASDNFDLMLFDMLKHTHEKPEDGMVFVDSGDNPMEQVVNVNNVNFLLVHGNGHRGIAGTPKIEGEVQKIKSRYAEQDIKIGYVLCGHIHSTYVSNGFSRSASLVGSNAFSERTLNFTSRASQNIFVVHEDGTVDGTMIDLQTYDGYDGFPFDYEMTHSNTAPLDSPRHKIHKI